MAGLYMKYFVLKPDSPKDHGMEGRREPDSYARAARIAIRAYARSIRHCNKKLADDLFQWMGDLEKSVNNCISDRISMRKATLKHVKEVLSKMTPSQRQAFSRRDGRCD